MSFDIFIKLNGSLSDIMYQTSAASIVADKSNKRLTVSVDNINKDYIPLLKNIKQYSHINCKNRFYDTNVLTDDLCAYIPKCKKNIEMVGSFKNKNYFQYHRDLLIKLYDLETDKDYSNSLYIYIDNSYLDNKDTYVRLLNENRDGDLQIIIDSDKYDSIKMELLEIRKEVSIVENNDYKKLIVMTNCGRGGYYTGETLGWWGSFLNKFSNNMETILSYEDKCKKIFNIISVKNIHIYKYIVITGNTLGGSYFWVIDNYKHFKLIKNKSDFDNIVVNKQTNLILNSFLFSDITLEFIEELKKKTNCKIIVPIHDCYWFCDEFYNNYNDYVHHVYLDKKRKCMPHMLQLFNLTDKFLVSLEIILQNIKHLIPDEYISKFEISTEPWDKKLKLDLCDKINILPNTTEINIGVFAPFSEYKGREQVEYLMKHFKMYNDKPINFYIVGINIPFYENNLKSFIEHVNKYQIHGFLLLNKWAETWCYTLDKILLTKIPLLYNNIGAFKERIVEDNMKYVINCQHENEYYDFNKLNSRFVYFLDNFIKMNKLIENIVFISSKIIVSSNKFSYCDSRSIYTSEERFDQTVKTIESIRKYIPNSYIILFDNSKLDINKYKLLKEKTDLFLNICNDDYINECTNNNIYKLYGELSQTAYVLNYIRENMRHVKFTNFFKISGRYLINDSFNYNSYLNDYNIFKKNKNVLDRKYYYTSFYKIAYNKLNEFTDIILNMFEQSKMNGVFNGYDWEVLLSMKINYNFIESSNLGITENISVWKQNTNI